MLQYHLNESIDESVEWISSQFKFQAGSKGADFFGDVAGSAYSENNDEFAVIAKLNESIP